MDAPPIRRRPQTLGEHISALWGRLDLLWRWRKLPLRWRMASLALVLALLAVAGGLAWARWWPHGAGYYTAARVGDERVAAADILAERLAAGADPAQIGRVGHAEPGAAEGVIDRILLATEAKRRGIALDAAAQRAARAETNTQLAGIAARRIGQQVAAPSEAAIDAFIPRHPAQFARRATLMLEQIAVRDGAAAAPVLAAADTMDDVRAGLRRAHIAVAERRVGVRSSALPDEIQAQLAAHPDAPFATKAADGSVVVSHVVEREADPVVGEDARTAARATLLEQRQQGAIDAEVKRLRAASPVRADPAEVAASLVAAPSRVPAAQRRTEVVRALETRDALAGAGAAAVRDRLGQVVLDALTQRAQRGQLAALLEKRVAAAVPAPDARALVALRAANPQMFAQRSRVAMEAITFAPSEALNLAELRRLETLDDVELQLKARDVKFNRQTTAVDTARFPAAAAMPLITAQPGALVWAGTPAAPFAAVVRARMAVIAPEPAQAALAREAGRAAAQTTALAALRRRLRAGAAITYEPGYAPPRAAR